jgi:hypothetical protein
MVDLVEFRAKREAMRKQLEPKAGSEAAQLISQPPEANIHTKGFGMLAQSTRSLRAAVRRQAYEAANTNHE